MRFNSVINTLINKAGHRFLHILSNENFKAYLSFSGVSKDVCETGRNCSKDFTLIMKPRENFSIKLGDIISDEINDSERQFKVIDINTVSAYGNDLYYLISLRLREGDGENCLHT